MNSEIDLTRFGFSVGDRVALADDDWNLTGHDIVVVDAEPVPGSTQVLIKSGGEVRTVGRGELSHV